VRMCGARCGIAYQLSVAGLVSTSDQATQKVRARYERRETTVIPIPVSPL